MDFPNLDEVARSGCSFYSSTAIEKAILLFQYYQVARQIMVSGIGLSEIKDIRYAIVSFLFFSFFRFGSARLGSFGPTPVLFCRKTSRVFQSFQELLRKCCDSFGPRSLARSRVMGKTS